MSYFLTNNKRLYQISFLCFCAANAEAFHINEIHPLVLLSCTLLLQIQRNAVIWFDTNKFQYFGSEKKFKWTLPEGTRHRNVSKQNSSFPRGSLVHAARSNTRGGSEREQKEAAGCVRHLGNSVRTREQRETEGEGERQAA